MSNPTRALAMLSISLLFGCATGPSGKVFESPIGEWTEYYEGSMGEIDVGAADGMTRTAKFAIIDENSGVYKRVRVQFYAKDEQRRWRGFWIMNTASKYNLCPEKKEGSDFWGETVFQFNEAYNQYTGYWDRCGEGKKYAIRGVR